MGLSIGFAIAYVCFIKKRPLLFGLTLWALGYHALGPTEMKRQDKSKVLADHLAWSMVVHAVSRAAPSPRTTSPGPWLSTR